MLYITPVGKSNLEEQVITQKINELAKKYAGIGVEKVGTQWKITIPEALRESHEAHFARVTEKFLEYLKAGKLPDWEVPNMLAKYYTTTTALEVAQKQK